MKGELIYGEINGGEISVHLTRSALKYLNKTERPIYVGLELYFTYFMRKKVQFYEERPDNELIKFSDNLYIYFRALQSRICKVSELKGDHTDYIDMPVVKRGALVPKFVRIDRKKKKWQGDFTWKSGNEYLNTSNTKNLKRSE